jgi:NitT/TauT family transport system ATP-binding protein
MAFRRATGSRQVLESVNLALEPGQFLTIVGASGTGKTTLLRVLGGLVQPTAGEVVFKGTTMTSPQLGVAIVFQDYSHALLEWRTVGGNVALGIEDGLAKPARDTRVRQTLRLVGLERAIDDYPRQLSGGMQQRVQIARALAMNPDVLLMDEPFGALDAMTKQALQDELLRIQAETATSFIFITHDIDEAVYLGDRCAVITGSPGRIAQSFAIDLPRPRNQVLTRQTPDFLSLRAKIHAAIGVAGHALG